MRAISKALLLAAIWIAAAWAIYAWSIRPYRCSVVLRGALMRTEQTASLADTYITKHAARGTIDALAPCVDFCDERVNALMVLAANYRFLSRPGTAVTLYEEALRYDRRPELYLNLGLAQTEAGDEAAGLQNLVTACIYNPSLLDAIASEQPRVRTAVGDYQLRLLAKSHAK